MHVYGSTPTGASRFRRRFRVDLDLRRRAVPIMRPEAPCAKRAGRRAGKERWREEACGRLSPFHVSFPRKRESQSNARRCKPACYAVYIMASRRNGTLYVGVTNNIALRAHQHAPEPVENSLASMAWLGWSEYELHRTSTRRSRRDETLQVNESARNSPPRLAHARASRIREPWPVVRCVDSSSVNALGRYAARPDRRSRSIQRPPGQLIRTKSTAAPSAACPPARR